MVHTVSQPLHVIRVADVERRLRFNVGVGIGLVSHVERRQRFGKVCIAGISGIWDIWLKGDRCQNAHVSTLVKHLNA